MLLWLLYIIFQSLCLAKAKACEINLGVCLDTSKSLTADDILKEIMFVIKFYRELLNSTSFVPLKLATFGDTVEEVFDYSTYNDSDKLLEALAGQTYTPNGSTATGDCLNFIATSPKPNDNQNIILVMANEDWNNGTHNPFDVAEQATKSGTLIYAAGFNIATQDELFGYTNGHTDRYIYTKKPEDLLKHVEDLTKNIPTSIPCKDFPTPENSIALNVCDVVPQGKHCNILCDKGYERNGIQPICGRCGFYETVPTCEKRKYCKTLPSIANVNITWLIRSCSDTKVNETCRVKCKDGNFLKNDPLCLENGRWKVRASCKRNHRSFDSAKKRSGASFPFWAYIIIVLAVVAICSAIAYYFYHRRKKAKDLEKEIEEKSKLFSGSSVKSDITNT